MHDIYEIETYLKYHSEDLARDAEHRRQILQLKRMQHRVESERFNMHVEIKFGRMPGTEFGQIVIKGALK